MGSSLFPAPAYNRSDGFFGWNYPAYQRAWQPFYVQGPADAVLPVRTLPPYLQGWCAYPGYRYHWKQHLKQLHHVLPGET